MEQVQITIETFINAPMERVWSCWTQPGHITQWNFASPDWCCPRAINNLEPGGDFSWRMEARDGSMGFDFEGTYLEIKEQESVVYQINDGRTVRIGFRKEGDAVRVTETFGAEGIHSVEMQRAGWLAILENFRHYVEAMV